MQFLGLLFKVCLLSLMVFSSAVAEQKIKVVTSFSILADWVEVLGGEQLDILSLVGPDEDVHVYHASPDDLRELAKADLMIINGMGLEGWLERLIKASGFKGQLLRASEGVTPIRFERAFGHHHGHHSHHNDHDSGFKPGVMMGLDPHAWLSPKMAKHYVKNIAQALQEVAPQYQEHIAQNHADYQLQLDALDARIRASVQGLPLAKRQVVVPHSAFAYFERDYGIRFYSLQGMSTEAESSAAAFAQIVRTIREQGIDAIFSENISNQKLIERVASETGLTLGGNLLSGALSAQLAPSYLDMINHNTRLLLGALDR